MNSFNWQNWASKHGRDRWAAKTPLGFLVVRQESKTAFTAHFLGDYLRWNPDGDAHFGINAPNDLVVTTKQCFYTSLEAAQENAERIARHMIKEAYQFAYPEG